jgi:mono/diheme cytochrome c family protein
MRSWSTLQPGELFGCVGCHEPKDSIIANTSGQTTDALKKPVAIPQNFYEPGPGYRQNDGFSYVRDIQPIFDRNCVSCHDGGESAPAPNLTADYAASLDDEMKENVISASPTFNC